MPTSYKRKPGVKPRGKWTIDQLQEAITKYQAGEIGLREAERYYGVPARTIKRRIASNNTTSTSLGPSCTLGRENEERLVKQINRLCDAGFCPDRTTVRRLAFEFAEALKIDHRFNRETKLAGYDWLWSFLRRNPTLSIRIAEGLSSKSNPDSLVGIEKKNNELNAQEIQTINLFSEIKVLKKSNMETNEGDKLLDMSKEENYSSTSKKCDCATCKRLFHEDFTIFEDFCVDCGRQKRNKKD